MTSVALRRLIGLAPMALGIATLVFVVVNLAPGDPVLLRAHPSVSPAALEQMRANLGLDQPIHVRYARWLGALVRGDLGMSYYYDQPVGHVIRAVLPNTLLLGGAALACAFLVGIGVGLLQALSPRSPRDTALNVGTLFFFSMPSFWLALMLILVFSLLSRQILGFSLPPSGIQSVFHDQLGLVGRIVDRTRHLALPALSLTLVLAAGVARYVRGSMIEVLEQDYIRTARAKGLAESAVVLRHALRNGLIPVVTLLGLYLPILLSGAVFVETVFAWPGMGKLMIDSIHQRDYPVVMAVSLVFAAVVVLGNAIADLLYAVVDPRVRPE